jgi:hypothetical protein
VFLVGQQREGQLILVGEALFARFVEDADAEHRRLAGREPGKAVAKTARFPGAAGSVVLWIKVENDGSARIVGQPSSLSILIRQRERRCCGARLDQRHDASFASNSLTVLPQ